MIILNYSSLPLFFVCFVLLLQCKISGGRKLPISCACRLRSWQVDSYAQDINNLNY